MNISPYIASIRLTGLEQYKLFKQGCMKLPPAKKIASQRTTKNLTAEQVLAQARETQRRLRAERRRLGLNYRGRPYVRKRRPSVHRDRITAYAKITPKPFTPRDVSNHYGVESMTIQQATECANQMAKLGLLRVAIPAKVGRGGRPPAYALPALPEGSQN